MPTVANVTISPVVASSGRRGAPVKLFRKLKRKEIRNAIAKLNALINADARETRRAAALNYSPALVCGAPNSVLNNSFKRCLARLLDALSLKVGDE